MTNATHNFQSETHPTLTFIVNQDGHKVGASWAEGSSTPNAERKTIEETEARLYFDASGQLDFDKWIIILPKRKAAFARAIANTNAIIERAKAKAPDDSDITARNAALECFGYDAAEDEETQAEKRLEEAYEAIRLAPAPAN